VQLAPLSNPALVPQTAALALGGHEQPGRSLSEVLIEYMRARRLLLILDNCEHLVEMFACFAAELL
jgi:predicted ATPase